MKKVMMILIVVAVFFASARGQGFLNLNFEVAFGTGTNFPGNPGNGILLYVTNALPDWTAFSGPNHLSQIYYVSNVLGHAQDVELESGTLALSGNNLSVGLYNDGSISQTAVVPATAESLDFEAEGPGGGGSLGAANLSLTLGGQNLSYTEITTGPDYIIYGANVPANMDGLMETLIFGCQGIGSGDVLLDDIDFSPLPVPEPSEYALMGVGAILFGICYRRKQQRMRA